MPLWRLDLNSSLSDTKAQTFKPVGVSIRWISVIAQIPGPAWVLCLWAATVWVLPMLLFVLLSKQCTLVPFVSPAVLIHIPLTKLTFPSCLIRLMGASSHANKNRNGRNSAARREKRQRRVWLLSYEYTAHRLYSPSKQNKTKQKQPHSLILITVCSVIFKWLIYLINMEMWEHSLFLLENIGDFITSLPNSRCLIAMLSLRARPVSTKP